MNKIKTKMSTKRIFYHNSLKDAREFFDWFGKYPDGYEPPRKKTRTIVRSETFDFIYLMIEELYKEDEKESLEELNCSMSQKQLKISGLLLKYPQGHPEIDKVATEMDDLRNRIDSLKESSKDNT